MWSLTRSFQAGPVLRNRVTLASRSLQITKQFKRASVPYMHPSTPEHTCDSVLKAGWVRYSMCGCGMGPTPDNNVLRHSDQEAHG